MSKLFTIEKTGEKSNLGHQTLSLNTTFKFDVESIAYIESIQGLIRINHITDYNWEIKVAKLFDIDLIINLIINHLTNQGCVEVIEEEIITIKPSWFKRFWSSIKELFSNS